MPLSKAEISKIRNKVVRGQLLAKEKKDRSKDKLRKRIERREAEKRGEQVEKGFTRTIENTREWLGDSEEWSDPRTRPAAVRVDDETGDVRVDLGSLSNLFGQAEDGQPEVSTSSATGTKDAKVLITTSPGKPPSPFTRDFCQDLQGLLGGKDRADVVPRRSPKFELGKVARWARKRGYGAILVVGEDHSKPTSLTLSLLPHGPTAHFRLTGITLSKDIKGRASPTSHPPELVLNHFQTPLGLSLANLLSKLFLPPQKASLLEEQGYVGRQVVLAQNSRDFVFVRRYRYMFVLKSHRLGKTVKRKQPDLDKMTNHVEEDEDDTIKTRFQEIGPRMTIKMRWIRRGPLGETGDERTSREKREQAAQEEEEGDVQAEFGERNGKGDMDGEVDAVHDEAGEAADEEAAAAELGLDSSIPTAGASEDTGDDVEMAVADEREPEPELEKPKKKRKRSKPSHPLLRPERSGTPPLGQEEAEPVPHVITKKGRVVEDSALSAVGKTWHAGKGEGGVREKQKHREWSWDARMQVSRRKFFL